MTPPTAPTAAGPGRRRELGRPPSPRGGALRLVRALLALSLGLLSLSAQGSPGEPAAETVAVTAECRFLSLGDEEARFPLTPERLAALVDVLRRTPMGGLVAAQLERFHRDGFGDGERRLRLFEVQREGGPAAEYFESGELYLRSGFLAGLDDATGAASAELYTAASFVVHEMVHAMSHHLHLIGEFPEYRADTKVNEALAFFIQGLYLNEVRALNPAYRETEAVSAWDECTARIVRILRDYGISEAMAVDQAYDQLAEWQLMADEPTALRLAKLSQYLQFISASGEAEQLWGLDEADLPRQRVVETLIGMIAEDVEGRNCNLEHTFAFMQDRIILYAHYPETPPGVTACEYFGSFIHALRRQTAVAEVLGEAIDQWLIERGLVPADAGGR